MPTNDKVFIFDNILECIVILSVEGIFQVYKNPSKLTDCSMRLFIILMYFLVHGLNPLYNQSVVFWYGLGQVIRWTYWAATHAQSGKFLRRQGVDISQYFMVQNVQCMSLKFEIIIILYLFYLFKFSNKSKELADSWKLYFCLKLNFHCMQCVPIVRI